MVERSEAKTRGLLATYLVSSSIYLSAQVLLLALSWWSYTRHNVHTFWPHNPYFIGLGISAALVVGSYWVLRKMYRPRKEHYLLYAISWCSLFLPQILATFLHGISIIYPTWTLILATTATGTIVFHDLVLVDTNALSRDAAQFVYNELRFYLDKLFLVTLTLGTGVGVMMTILWTAPEVSFHMVREQREFWAVYMLFSFLTVGVLLAISVVYPILSGLRRLRIGVFESQAKNDFDRRRTSRGQTLFPIVALVAMFVALYIRKWLRALGRFSDAE